MSQECYHAKTVSQSSGALVKILQVGLPRSPAPGLQLEAYTDKTKLHGCPQILLSLEMSAVSRPAPGCLVRRSRGCLDVGGTTK